MFVIISPCFSVLQIMINFFQVSIIVHLSAWSLFSLWIPSYVGSFAILEAGWSQFAQFTISVLSQDLKKSKFSGDFFSLNLRTPV